MSQYDVAEELGLTQASVARYERALAYPSNEALVWYADTFGVSIDWLYGRTNELTGKTHDVGIHKTRIKGVNVEDIFSGEDFYKLIEGMVKQAVEKLEKEK